MTKIRNIIWDWNGTLLNDPHVCVDSINVLLSNRSLPALDLVRYRDIFTFPVKDYYFRAGFDFSREPFTVPAHEFMDLYRQRITETSLHEGAVDLLTSLGSHYHQYILSAMEKNLLADLLRHFDIGKHFRGVYGIDDHYANGKERWAEKLIAEHGIDKEEVVLVGDTLHDHEVAAHVHIPCILVSHGHQSEGRLLSSGRRVVSSLHEIPSLLERADLDLP